MKGAFLVFGAVLACMLLLGCTTAAGPGQNATPARPDATASCDADCPSGYSPVCGADNRTYWNACKAACVGASIVSQGECVPPRSCNDSDRGVDVYSKGTVKSSGGRSGTDRCLSASSVEEYYCEDDRPLNETLACPVGFGCEDGACIAGTREGCTDSDGNDTRVKGVAAAGGGSYEDACTDRRHVKEYFCGMGRLMEREYDCGAGYACEEGRCISTSVKCSETDGGDDIYSGGTLSVMINLISAEYIDKCLDGDTVREYYCTTDGYRQVDVDCPQGTRCVLASCRADLCVDTDGGYALDRKGAANKGDVIREDACTSGTGGTEYVCEGNEILGKEFACPAGQRCDGGKCG